jgi:polyhydroxyalkanoate synthase
LQKLRFFTRQFINATSPTNFASINPEIISKTVENNGINLLTGFKNFIDDLQQGKGLLDIKITDPDGFKLGENIACTPGKVVYQNDLMQLIQYTATTEKVYELPLLIIPPWINKYYILDLQPENSFVKWIVDQGYTVFIISWANVTSEHREKQFADYMREGPLAALKIIKKISKANNVNVLGYCIGGTLLACMLSYLAKKTNSYVKSATFLTTLLDFSEPGDLGLFTNKSHIEIIEKLMLPKGYLDGHVMAAIFNTLRANDLIWSSFINNYLKGQNPKPFDLLYWNADPTNIPEHVHRFYLKNMYLHNNLIKPGEIKLANTPIDLSDITLPSYFLAAQDDHIVPWTSSYMGKKYFSGSTKFVLTGSGHVAGVINPPNRNKYHYWTNNTITDVPEKYLEKATYHEGSWWNDWIKWIKKYSGKKCSVGDLNLIKSIEDAPGSYVKVRLNKV